MARTPATSDRQSPGFFGHVHAWLVRLRHGGRPWLFLAGALLVVSCAGAAVVAAGNAEQQRRALTGRDYSDAASLAAEVVVIGLALDAGEIPPRLAAGEQVVLLDTGGDGGQPLVDTASVTALATDGAGAVRIGLEVPASTAGKVAASGAQGRLVLARLPMA